MHAVWLRHSLALDKLLRICSLLLLLLSSRHLDRDIKIIVSQDWEKQDWLRGFNATPRLFSRRPDYLNYPITRNTSLAVWPQTPLIGCILYNNIAKGFNWQLEQCQVHSLIHLIISSTTRERTNLCWVLAYVLGPCARQLAQFISSN